MRRIKYSFSTILLLFSVCVYGQYFKKLGMEDGLSNPSVLAIYQDILGRIWFGTNEGINVYDGKQIYKYISYDVVEGQFHKEKLINGEINQIVGDDEGNIFIRNNGTLIKYDIRKESLRELRSSNIGALAVIKGKVWCAVRDSLFKYDADTDSLCFFREINTSYIWCIEEMSDKLWIGTAKGLYALEDDTVKCVLPDVEIFKLFVSSRNELWIASRMKGLYKIGRDGILKKELHSPTRVVSEQIRDFIEDDQQNIWFGTFEGLQVYNPYSDTYSVYRPSAYPGSLEHQSVFSLYKDRQGTIWIGTYYGGVNYFNKSKDIFHYYPYSKLNKDGLSFPIVGQMVEDKDRNLWICTDGGGVNCLDRKTGTFTYYMASGINSILHNNTKSITYDDKRDQIYIGTYTGGVSRYDRKSRKFYNYLTDYERTKNGPNRIIYHVLFKDNWLYVSARNGFWRLNPETNEFQLINKNRLYLTFEIDSRGYIWLTADYNLYRMKIGEWTRVERINIEKIAERKAKITRIMEATDGMVYVSTLGNGIFTYNYETKEWKHHTAKQDNLISDFCYNMVETPKNNILITSDRGISLYSPFNNSIYSIELGLKGGISAVTDGCGVWTASDDLIYIGGVDGMISFREKDLYLESESHTEFYFSNLHINNAIVRPGDKSGVLSQALPFTNSLDLAYHQNNLMIDFSSSNYVEHERNVRFQYKLEGFDKEWISTDQLRIGYTNLAPGNYVLKVRESKSKILGKGYKEIALDIKIHHPWFATFWAFLVYLIIMAIIIYVFWKIRTGHRLLALSLAKEKDEKERIEELNKMKLRFFTNISHEFRTPLTLIIGQIEMLLQLDKLSPTLNKRLHGIYKNAMNLRFLITELLDFRKQEQGFLKLKVECVDIIPFMKEVYQSFIDLARKRNISYTFEHAEEKIDLWFDAIQMQKVLFNLLSNAFKYTPEGGHIKISIKRQQRTVEIAVADTGCGIPEGSLSKIFERFYQVNDGPGKNILGSGIGLAFTKGIVDAHKGEIKVESVLGEGSCFKIQLLLGNGHFTAEELEYEQTVVHSLDWEEEGILIAEEILPDNTALENDDPLEEEKEGLPSILIVEDDEEMLDMLVGIFSPTYTVHKAMNGQIGFDMACQLHPNLIVSDVMMPVMSGSELCSKIKNSLELSYIPVVLLTAQSSVDYTIEGYMSGADDYITKPFNVKVLLTRCNNLLNSRKKLMARLNMVIKEEQDVKTLGTSIVDQKLLDTATAVIKQNFDNPDFDMNMLASELNMGRSKLFLRFKEVVGLTPNEFTLKLKLEEALRMLKEEPQYNVSEISYRLGFSSSRYFSRCFKDLFGVSPQNYRKKIH